MSGLSLRLVLSHKLTPCYYQRAAATMGIQNAAIEAGLGGGVGNMFAVHDLAAHPKRQGRGYGKALLNAANAKVSCIARFPIRTVHGFVLMFL